MTSQKEQIRSITIHFSNEEFHKRAAAVKAIVGGWSEQQRYTSSIHIPPVDNSEVIGISEEKKDKP